MIFLWDYYEVSKWGSYGVSTGCLRDFHGGSLEFLWDFKGMSIGISLDSYDISMRLLFLWDFSGISMIFLLDVYDISMVLLLDFYEIPMVFLWDFHDVSMVFL